MALKLWLISWGGGDWDTYDSAVVAAETEAEAKATHPNGGWLASNDRTWANTPEEVNCELIGQAEEGRKKGVVCASFNAG